jgi:hypothetical protein
MAFKMQVGPYLYETLMTVFGIVWAGVIEGPIDLPLDPSLTRLSVLTPPVLIPINDPVEKINFSSPKKTAKTFFIGKNLRLPIIITTYRRRVWSQK